MASQVSELVKLPRELLDNVATSLPTQDFNSLRLACKELEAKTFPYWANCFFKKRQFMIDQFSLQTLVDISQHDALSKVISHLIIGLDEFRAFNLDRAFSSAAQNLQPLAEFDRWRSADCTQQALLYGGGAVDMLSRALVNLPNLRTIDLRDFNSPTRYRDAVPRNPSPQWRSYGSSHYQQWPLGRCSTTGVQSLEVILRNHHFALGDDAFSLSGVPGSQLAAALRGLTKLHLDLNSHCPHLSGLSHVQVTMPKRDFFDPATTHLRRFLGLTPSITWLRLNFYPNIGASHRSSPSKLIAWLGLEPNTIPPPNLPWGPGNPAPITLPLRRLDLGNVKTSPVIFRRLLKKFTRLECISIRDICLRDAEATSDSHESDIEDNDDCLWARFIRNLHATNQNIKKVELSRLMEETSHGSNTIVFCNEAVPSEYTVFASIQITDTASLRRLADNTWTDIRWHKSQGLGDGDVVDEDGEIYVDSELDTDEDSEGLSEDDGNSEDNQ
ncbi:f-box domain containing protein [Diaporthe amygdali]|uniref:f-box domain containing protein n=1 Tax=Phomopsis amygdali TaxID=1214568 RepID=UPI0022FE0CBD|nr:f-box domain containing protein [Diaporthe amygdali]KAJ0114811.1 f-box domain containing protein [Diaporthe amygdali]